MYKLKCLKLFLTTRNDLYFKYFLITKGATANHAQELGFRTIFLEDCSRGIDPNDIKDTLDGVRSNHGVVISSSEVKKKSRDRHYISRSAIFFINQLEALFGNPITLEPKEGNLVLDCYLRNPDYIFIYFYQPFKN